MDIKKLLTRAVSGLIYCFIIVGCAFLGTSGITALGILLAVLACAEFTKICHEITNKTLPVLMIDIAGCILLTLGYLGYPLVGWAVLMIVRMVLELYMNTDKPLKNLAHSSMTQIYIGIPLGLMTFVAAQFSPMVVLVVFFLLWINDTGAFLVGSMMGRHKLFERISPKKTWEGFVGGLIFSIVASAMFYYYCNSFFHMDAVDANLATWLGLGVIVCIFGTWGDLVESMIKRTLHVKDSGNLIPGHGGILDRIDSLLLAAPAAAVYLVLVSWHII